MRKYASIMKETKNMSLSVEKFKRCKTEGEEITQRREKLALRNKVQSEKPLEIYGGLS